MNKYNAKKCEYEGITFDSKKELKRYIILRELEKKGEIRNLERQVKYELLPTQRGEDGKVVERGCRYIADFKYEKDGKTVVEDVKGCRYGQAYNLFVMKRKLMLFIHGIRIREV